MDSNGNNQYGQHSTDVHELARGLEKELRLRIEVGSGSSAVSSPSSPATSLEQTLASCLSNLPKKTSPSTANPNHRERPGISQYRVDSGSFHLPSPHSDDSSMSGAAKRYLSAEEMERNTTAPSLLAATNGSTRSLDIGDQTPLRDTRSTSTMQAGARGPNLSAQSLTATVASGRNGQFAPASVGGSTSRVSRRRSRASKKLPTQLIQADPQDFRATVQHLTGCETSPSRVLPASAFQTSGDQFKFVSSQPEDSILSTQSLRASHDHMDFNSHSPRTAVGNFEASPVVDDSIRCPSPVPQAPGINIASRDSLCTRSGNLNYCMGYDQSSVSFVELSPSEDLGMTTSDSKLTHLYHDYSGFFEDAYEKHLSGSASPTDQGVAVPSSSRREIQSRDDIISREKSSFFSSELGFSSSGNIPNISVSEDLIAKRRRLMEDLELDDTEGSWLRK